MELNSVGLSGHLEERTSVTKSPIQSKYTWNSVRAYLANGDHGDIWGKHLYFQHMKSHVSFWLAYSYLDLSKGQG